MVQSLPPLNSLRAFTDWIGDEAAVFSTRLERLGRAGLALAAALP
jgi:hypothetical protein